MSADLRGAVSAALVRMGTRRAAFRTLAALLGASGAARAASHGSEARRHRRNPRKRLRRQCKKQCKHVHHDCVNLCHAQGYPDEICHPRCATAKHACRRGC